MKNTEQNLTPKYVVVDGVRYRVHSMFTSGSRGKELFLEDKEGLVVMTCPFRQPWEDGTAFFTSGSNYVYIAE